MSSDLVLSDVSNQLKTLIRQKFDEAYPTGEAPEIVFRPPSGGTDPSSNRLSLWLYQVAENEFVKNQPPVRLSGNGAGNGARLRVAPLALNLYFLVTPFGSSAEKDQVMLGRVMRVLFDNAIVPMRTSSSAAELRISLCRFSLEEHTRIWDALREPYRLSLCYQVRVTTIDSDRIRSHGQVVEQSTGFADKAAAEEAEETAL